MIKKFLYWLVFVGIGASILFFVSNNALGTETNYFRKLLLSNNKDFALLISRQIIDELKQIKRQMEGFSRLIQKENFDNERLKNHMKYHYDGHSYISGIRFRHKDSKKWVSFKNLNSRVISDTFLKTVHVDYDNILSKNKDFFSKPYFDKDLAYASRIQIIRERRKNLSHGVLETQFSVDKLFGVSKVIMKGKNEGILMLDSKGNILFPTKGIWQISQDEFKDIRRVGIGGFSRMNGMEEELLSFASLKILDPVNMPDWYLVFVQDDAKLRSFADRMGWNIYSILVLGLVCLAFLGKILFFRG
jgi:hypothetical protein